MSEQPQSQTTPRRANFELLELVLQAGENRQDYAKEILNIEEVDWPDAPTTTAGEDDDGSPF